MKAPFLFFIFCFFLILTSCQVKETKSSGGLISGHVPTTNSFTLHNPTAGTYQDGDTITVMLSFPFEVTVSGAPRVELTVGSTTKYATYTSGTGTKEISFEYDVVVSDRDSDGVVFESLELNGGTLTFDNNGVTTNCSTTLSAKTFASVIVDNGPYITGFSLASAAGFYHIGSTINFTVTFNEAAYVTGVPRIAVDFTGGAAAYATYTGGSGTTSLSFRYTITSSTWDYDGYDSITSPIDLNSGTIKNANGVDADLIFSSYTAAVITASASVDFDGRLPYIVSVTLPSNGTYIESQDMDFTVEFNRAVTVTGSPYIGITVGSTARQATYSSGSGTTTLIFTYTPQAGDVDLNGIAVATTMTQNSGDIVGSAAPANSYFVSQNNTFTLASTSALLVNTVPPSPISVARSADTTSRTFGVIATDNIWIIGQSLTITVDFSANVTVTGTPRIPIDIGGATQYATYLSGSTSSSLVFRYIIQDGDEDTDGTVDMSDIDLNGGTIRDAYSTNAELTLTSSTLTSTTVDGIKPTITSIDAPTDGTYSTVSGVNHTNMTFTINWSEAVHYSATTSAAVYIPLTVGITALNAIYTSGNDTDTILHNPASLTGYNDDDGISMTAALAGTATIKDEAGNSATVSYTPPDTTQILVDTTAPAVFSISPPADATYIAGGDLDFDITFTEPVTVNVDTGYPRISLVVGVTTRYLVPTANSTGLTHTFRYTVVTNDTDTNGVAMGNTVSSSGLGYARDGGLNNVAGTYTPAVTSSVLVDAVAPSISSRIPPSNGTYTENDSLSITLNFSEVVFVTGTPQIQVAAQTGTLNFEYASGTGTAALVFTYAITADDFDFDGLSSSVATIDFNGGDIADAGGTSSTTSFTAIDLSSIFIAYPNTIVWTTSTFINRAPTGGGITLTSGGAATNTSCGLVNCRRFNGDDTLSISGGISGIEHLFLVFRTASTYAANQTLISPLIALVNDTTNYDMSTADASLDLNGVSFGAGTSHATNMSASTVGILQADFTSAESLSSGIIIPTTFNGGIGDIIIVNGPLTGTQKSQILIYLNNRY